MNLQQHQDKIACAVPAGYVVETHRAALDRRVRAIMSASRGLDYLAAAKQAEDGLQHSVQTSANASSSVVTGARAAPSANKPGILPDGCTALADRVALDRRARSLMAATPGLDYLSAVKQADGTSAAPAQASDGHAKATAHRTFPVTANHGGEPGVDRQLDDGNPDQLFDALFKADVHCKQANADCDFHNELRGHLRGVVSNSKEGTATARAWYNRNLDALSQIRLQAQQNHAGISRISAERLATEMASNSRGLE